MPKSKPRKPNHREHGFNLTVCGKPITKHKEFVCTLPVRHAALDCASISYDKTNGQIITIVRRNPPDFGVDPEVWPIPNPNSGDSDA